MDKISLGRMVRRNCPELAENERSVKKWRRIQTNRKVKGIQLVVAVAPDISTTMKYQREANNLGPDLLYYSRTKSRNFAGLIMMPSYYMSS